MRNVFKGKTANAVWMKAAKSFIENDHPMQESRAGNTDEVLHSNFSISNPRQRWVASRVPAMNPAFAIAEVVWILNGRNDASFLTYWNKKLVKYSGKSANLHGAYGYRLREHIGFDQLHMAFNTLSHNPTSRQVVLQIWDANIDLPIEEGKPRDADIPCNIFSLLKIRDNKLHWMQICRSNDLILGVPYNFIQFTFLQEVLAGWLGVEVGDYVHICDSLHIYHDKMESLNGIQTIRATNNTDLFVESKEESEALFTELARKLDQLIRNKLTEVEHLQLCDWQDAPKAYQNLLCIMGAEGARRRKWSNLPKEIMRRCSNPALKQIWSLWASRFSR